MEQIKRKEKMNKFIEFLLTYGWAILIILIAIGALIFSYNQPVEKDFCEENPGECTCEKTVFCSYASEICNNENIFDFPDVYEECVKYRPKTDFEKETEYCNKYPGNETKCHCEEYRIIANLITDRILVDKIKGEICCNSLVTEKEGKTFIYNNCRYCQENLTYILEERICLRARPRTECEKGNLSWIEETNQIINIKWLNNCCEDIFINIANNKQTYIANKICFEADSKEWQIINSINVSKCQQTSKLINRIICREKTDVEKLTDLSCKELSNHFKNFNCELVADLQSSQCSNTKTAWRNKSCEI